MKALLNGGTPDKGHDNTTRWPSSPGWRGKPYSGEADGTTPNRGHDITGEGSRGHDNHDDNTPRQRPSNAGWGDMPKLKNLSSQQQRVLPPASSAPGDRPNCPVWTTGKHKGWEHPPGVSCAGNIPGITGFDNRWDGDEYLATLTHVKTLQANKRSRVYRCATPSGETVVVKVYPSVCPSGQANYYHPEKAHHATHLDNEIWALKTLADWEYSPALLYQNLAALTVVMEDVGETVETRSTGPSTDIPLARRHQILAWAADRVRDLQQRERPLYHNDIYLRNICCNPVSQKLFLVDYGHLDYKEARGEAPDAKLDQLKGDLGLGGHFHGRIQ